MVRKGHQQLTTHFITTIRGKSKPQRFFDRRGDGLHLLVAAVAASSSNQKEAKPSKSWVIRCNVEGIRFERGLGSFPTVGLKEARHKARLIQVELEQGRNPFKEADEEKKRIKKAKAEAKRTKRRDIPFSQLVFEYYKIHEPTWTAKHSQVWLSMFRNHVFESMGDRPVGGISTADLGKLLAPLVVEKPDTAKRLRQRIEAVFEWAIVCELLTGDNPAQLSRLRHVLPKNRKPIRHRAALPWRQAPKFWSELQEHRCASALALQLLILTCVRSGEARGAVWPEINIVDRVWTIPPERMKARNGHRVPLSGQVLTVLEQSRGKHPNVVFPSDRVRVDGTEYLGENALTSFLKKSMGESRFTPHGFRSTFRDWASEYADIPREISEKVLAHKVGDAVERAYARSDLLEKRREAMQLWADFLTGKL